MEVHVLASTKEKALSARAEKGSKERTAKKSTSVFLTLAKMVQRVQKELEEDTSAHVPSATRGSLVKNEAFVIQIPV